MRPTSILITGCSSGIGYASAKALKARGYRVFATARKPEDLERLTQEGLEAIRLDINSSDSIAEAVQTVLAKTGGTLDALFNNAGMLQAGAIEDLSRDHIRAQFETNVFGPMELIRAVLPTMRKQGHGRIIQNSSILGVITLPYYGAYNASKYALEGFSNTLRQELHDTNIHVSILNPGPILSELRSNAHTRYQDTIKQQDNVHEKAYEKLEATYFKRSKRDEQASGDPSLVTKKLIHALESKHPKAHYFVGLPAQAIAVLRRIFPDCVMDWFLRKVR